MIFISFGALIAVMQIKTAGRKNHELPSDLAGRFENECKNRDCNEKKHYRREEIYWIASVILYAVAAIGAIGSFFYAKGAFELSSENFLADERPYLFVEDVKGQPLLFVHGQPASWNIRFVNYGKSQAVNAITEAHVWVGIEAKSKAEAFFKIGSTLSPIPVGGFQVPPNSTGGPNGFPYTRVLSDSLISPEDVLFLKANNAGVLIGGKTWYSDIFGQNHYTEFCRFTLVTGAISDCISHNSVK